MISRALGSVVLLSCFLAAGVAATASAEVRLRPTAGGSRASVIVQQTERGPWSPVGQIDELVLNPSGDLAGDGTPSLAAVRGVAAVAWSRPGTGVAVAVGASRWNHEQMLAEPEALGVPVLKSLPSGFAAVWQVGPDDWRVEASAISVAGMVSPETLVTQGTLVGAAVVNPSTLAVVAVSASGALSTTNVVSLYPIESPPIITSVAATISIERLAASVLAPTASTHTLPSPPIIPLKIADIRIHEGEHHGEPFALVTWWVAPDELHWIELTGDGPAFPVRNERSRGGTGYSPSLVEHAINEVRRK